MKVLARTPQIPAIVLAVSTLYWGRCSTELGIAHRVPRPWPWWQCFAFRHSIISVTKPSTGHRLYLYTRWGTADIEMTFDRRAWA